MQEECAEVISAIAKIKRHGYDSVSPTTLQNNRDHLAEELGHVLATLARLYKAGDVSEESVLGACQHKRLTGGKWLHHQPEFQL